MKLKKLNLLQRILISPSQFKAHYLVARGYVGALRAVRIALAFTWVHITHETI